MCQSFQIKQGFIVSAVMAAALCSLSVHTLQASPLVTPARQLGDKHWNSVLYYSNTFDHDVPLRVTQTDVITVSGVNFFSEVSNDFEAKGNGEAAFLKLMFQPWENLQYYGKIGQGSYDLEVPSVTVRNRSSGHDRGLIYGGGVKAVLFPDTIVSPAIAVDASFTHGHYKFDRLNETTAINHVLDLREYQLAFEASKRWERWEPYGGVKILRRMAKLRDKGTLASVGGRKELVSPFVGVTLQLYEHEYLVFEGSFVGDPAVSAGLSLRF